LIDIGGGTTDLAILKMVLFVTAAVIPFGCNHRDIKEVAP
jgi:cell division ATPase FtsA